MEQAEAKQAKKKIKERKWTENYSILLCLDRSESFNSQSK